MHAPKKLLVEGETDKRVIPYLMEKNGVAWESEGQPVVFIEPSGSINEILKLGVIEAELNASRLEVLGIVVDANGDTANRWTQIRDRCFGEFDKLPDEIPQDGLVQIHKTGVRFGVWIMPDNRLKGMLEDYLIGLIPQDSRKLLELAKRCVQDARNTGAPFKNNQTSKAELHTWLAWQDEPGRQLHQAVLYGILDARSPHSVCFAAWFRRLFEI